MNKIVFSTDEQFTRPIITLYGQQALIDSGADIPACNDADFLISAFNAQEVILPEKPSVNGVGKEKVFGRIFDVDMFIMKELMYPHLKFFVPDEPGFKTTFLLSASMFYGLVCTIDYEKHRYEIVVPDGQQLVRMLYLKQTERKISSSANKLQYSVNYKCSQLRLGAFFMSRKAAQASWIYLLGGSPCSVSAQT